jgi:flagellar basal body-associated protein FliL
MAKPVKPKDIKPKTSASGGEDGDTAASAGTEATGGGGMDLKFIITLVAIVLCTSLTSAASVYFLAPLVVVPAIEAKLPKGGAHGAEGQHGEGGEHGEDAAEAAEVHAPAIPMNLLLDDFTANLRADASTGEAPIIRVKMVLGIGVPDEENCHIEKHEAKEGEKKEGEGGGGHGGGGGGHGGGGHGGGAPPAAEGEDPCQKAFNEHMSPFIPAIRDIINGALMKRTATDLSTPEGQEVFKDEIKQQVGNIMGKKYKVQRVNFQDFIIQR